MKYPENAQEELRNLYSTARSMGKAHTQKEFAELLGIHPANISQFMLGTVPITHQMLQRIKDAAAAHGIVIQNNAPMVAAETINAPIAQAQTQNGNPVAQTTDPRWFELVSRKDEQIAEKDAQIGRLLGIIEKMQVCQ